MYNKISNNCYERNSTIPLWIYVDNVFNDQELDAMCEFFTNGPTKDATVISSKPGQQHDMRTDIRRSKISFYNRNQDTNWIYERLNQIIEEINEHHFNFILNGYNSFQYTEYHAADLGKYDFHMDIVLGKGPVADHYLSRKLSLVMMLNDPTSDFEGGDFLISESGAEPTKVEFKKGRLILFPSFIIHKVSPVTKGIRKTLVTWILGPKFR
jgi:PKHD-type hydroxylase